MIADDLEQLLYETLIADANVKGRVLTRVHPSEIALVANQMFPCICYSYGEARPEWVGFVGPVPMTFWVHSSKDYAEAQEIFQILFDKLHANRYGDARVNTVGRLASGPGKMYDGEIYTLVSIWNFTCIGV